MEPSRPRCSTMFKYTDRARGKQITYNSITDVDPRRERKQTRGTRTARCFTDLNQMKKVTLEGNSAR
ncbi:Hypothetical predicted protein [Xyrichtys novacula]|uniref:Uncharacterized protein n=1 Tax=Xyrichtys novacula TaxID=13765 RepID=A0AAV1GHZ2_XYRNO|nr:Hypothetical predicted protein [Xyrichtys novacula]